VPVLAFDLPGFGLSRPRGNFDFTLPAYVESVRELLLQARSKWAARSSSSSSSPSSSSSAPLRFCLAMPCVSGHTAMALARRDPELVHSVVAINTATPVDQLGWINRVDNTGMLQTPFIGQLACPSRGPLCRPVGLPWPLRTAQWLRRSMPSLNVRSLTKGRCCHWPQPSSDWHRSLSNSNARRNLQPWQRRRRCPPLRLRQQRMSSTTPLRPRSTL